MAILNEDGTEFNVPKDPEYDKLIPDNCIPRGRDPYMCMFCGRCPLGDNFVPNLEQREIIDRHRAMVDAYIAEHNPYKGYEGIQIQFNAE